MVFLAWELQIVSCLSPQYLAAKIMDWFCIAGKIALQPDCPREETMKRGRTSLIALIANLLDT